MAFKNPLGQNPWGYFNDDGKGCLKEYKIPFNRSIVQPLESNRSKVQPLLYNRSTINGTIAKTLNKFNGLNIKDS